MKMKEVVFTGSYRRLIRERWTDRGLASLLRRAQFRGRREVQQGQLMQNSQVICGQKRMTQKQILLQEIR